MAQTRAEALTEEQRAFLREGHYAVVTTLRADGSPHATVTWVDSDGEHVLVNITPERLKAHHLERDPRIAVLTIAGDDPYRWVSVSGTAELTTDGANEHIEALSWRYRGRTYGLGPGDQRLLARVRPERVTANNV